MGFWMVFFLCSEHLLLPNSGVWAEPSWFPFRGSGWLRPVIHRGGNKLLSGLCLSSRPVYFMLLRLRHSFPRVSHPSNYLKHFWGAITKGLCGAVKGGVGWLLAVWLKTCATKRTRYTVCSKRCQVPSYWRPGRLGTHQEICLHLHSSYYFYSSKINRRVDHFWGHIKHESRQKSRNKRNHWHSFLSRSVSRFQRVSFPVWENHNKSWSTKYFHITCQKLVVMTTQV